MQRPATTEIISINNKQMLGIKEQENIKNVKLAEVEANNEVAKKSIENEVIIAEKNVELHGKEAQVVAIKKEIAITTIKTMILCNFFDSFLDFSFF